MHICPLPAPIVPVGAHVGGPILPRSEPRTLINGKPAARVGDKAACLVPTPDTVRAGLITVFIDGSPASRKLDKTDMGSIIVGSPDVLLGEELAGPLTPYQAEWLYKYLDAQRNAIPFHSTSQRTAAMLGRIECVSLLILSEYRSRSSGCDVRGPAASFMLRSRITPAEGLPGIITWLLSSKWFNRGA
jgi:uncharacterized Zn-binding protein involved in type VI secretion